VVSLYERQYAASDHYALPLETDRKGRTGRDEVAIIDRAGRRSREICILYLLRWAI
jgi:hypothetical protein